MSIVNVLTERLHAARMAKSADVTMISTLLHEVVAKGKFLGNRKTTDAEAVGVIKKIYSNNADTIKLSTPERAASYIAENAFIDAEKFIPEVVTIDIIEEEVNLLISDIESPTMKDMGKVMGGIKAKFDGNYDGKVVSGLVRRLLNTAAV